MAKPNPGNVHSGIAKQALERAKDRGSVYSQYIVLHFRATGRLAPGCDAKDLYAWMDAQEDLPEAFNMAIKPQRGNGTGKAPHTDPPKGETDPREGSGQRGNGKGSGEGGKESV